MSTVHGRTYEIGFRERQKQVRHVPEEPGRRTYDWRRVNPAQKFEPSGELELLVGESSGHGYGWKKEWADTAKKPLEEQIRSVFRALKARAEEQEWARLEREVELRRLRQEAERRRLEAEGEEQARKEWKPPSTSLRSRRFAPYGPRASAQPWSGGGRRLRSGSSVPLWTRPRTPPKPRGCGSGRPGGAGGGGVGSIPSGAAGAWPLSTSTRSRRVISYGRSSTAGIRDDGEGQEARRPADAAETRYVVRCHRHTSGSMPAI